MKFDSETNGVRPELNFQNSWYMNMHSSYLHSCSRSLSLQFYKSYYCVIELLYRVKVTYIMLILSIV